LFEINFFGNYNNTFDVNGVNSEHMFNTYYGYKSLNDNIYSFQNYFKFITYLPLIDKNNLKSKLAKYIPGKTFVTMIAKIPFRYIVIIHKSQIIRINKNDISRILDSNGTHMLYISHISKEFLQYPYKSDCSNYDQNIRVKYFNAKSHEH
jgi:hypothetical protein